MWVRYLTISFSTVYLQEGVNAAQRGDGLPITTFLFEEHESMPGDVFKTVLKMLGPIAWIGLAAGLQMAGALLFFRLPTDSVLVGTYVVISFSIYLLNRFTDVEDTYNCPDRGALFQRWSPLAAIPVVLMMGSLVLLVHTRQWTAWHVALMFLGTVYSVRMIPWWVGHRFQRVRIKDILFLKNLSVSLLWGISPFAIARAQEGAAFPPMTNLLVVVLAFCLTTLMNTMSCDVRDIEGDRQAGVQTVATRFGPQGTGLLVAGIALLASMTVAAVLLTGGVSARVALLFFAAVAWTVLVALPLYARDVGLPKAISEPLIDTQQVFCGTALIVLAMQG